MEVCRVVPKERNININYLKKYSPFWMPRPEDSLENVMGKLARSTFNFVSFLLRCSVPSTPPRTYRPLFPVRHTLQALLLTSMTYFSNYEPVPWITRHQATYCLAWDKVRLWHNRGFCILLYMQIYVYRHVYE